MAILHELTIIRSWSVQKASRSVPSARQSSVDHWCVAYAVKYTTSGYLLRVIPHGVLEGRSPLVQ